ncbi:MAG: uncharacterized PurR-regulated membrane protein YhhQ (DUF165 family) [Thermoproteota archaeon]|jgi:uncharacterized PurR-regulated membrane protein YhhQ (DUF165 family)
MTESKQCWLLLVLLLVFYKFQIPHLFLFLELGSLSYRYLKLIEDLLERSGEHHSRDSSILVSFVQAAFLCSCIFLHALRKVQEDVLFKHLKELVLFHSCFFF